MLKKYPDTTVLPSVPLSAIPVDATSACLMHLPGGVGVWLVQVGSQLGAA